MLIFLLLSFLFGTLTLAGWYSQQKRILWLEAKVDVQRHIALAARSEAHAAWYAVNRIMRGLAADVPPEQWLRIIDEVRMGKSGRALVEEIISGVTPPPISEEKPQRRRRGRPKGTTNKARMYDRAVVALMTAPTIEKAAESLGVSRQSIHNWLRDPGVSRQAERDAAGCSWPCGHPPVGGCRDGDPYAD
jgi:hypothetical protein